MNDTLKIIGNDFKNYAYDFKIRIIYFFYKVIYLICDYLTNKFKNLRDKYGDKMNDYFIKILDG